MKIGQHYVSVKLKRLKKWPGILRLRKKEKSGRRSDGTSTHGRWVAKRGINDYLKVSFLGAFFFCDEIFVTFMGCLHVCKLVYYLHTCCIQIRLHVYKIVYIHKWRHVYTFVSFVYNNVYIFCYVYIMFTFLHLCFFCLGVIEESSNLL